MGTRSRVRGPSFEETSIMFTRESSVPSLIQIAPVVLEKKKFLNFVYAFLELRNHITWEKRMAKHESPLRKVWLKLWF